MPCVRVWRATPGEAFGQVWERVLQLSPFQGVRICIDHPVALPLRKDQKPPKPEGLQAARIRDIAPGGSEVSRFFGPEMLKADFGFGHRAISGFGGISKRSLRKCDYRLTTDFAGSGNSNKRCEFATPCGKQCGEFLIQPQLGLRVMHQPLPPGHGEER